MQYHSSNPGIDLNENPKKGEMEKLLKGRGDPKKERGRNL